MEFLGEVVLNFLGEMLAELGFTSVRAVIGPTPGTLCRSVIFAW